MQLWKRGDFTTVGHLPFNRFVDMSYFAMKWDSIHEVNGEWNTH